MTGIIQTCYLFSIFNALRCDNFFLQKRSSHSLKQEQKQLIIWVHFSSLTSVPVLFALCFICLLKFGETLFRESALVMGVTKGTEDDKCINFLFLKACYFTKWHHFVAASAY